MNSGHRIWCPSTAAYPTPVCHQCRLHSPSVHVSMCGVFRRVQLGFGPTECKAARRVARNMAPEDNYRDALHRAPKCSKSRPHNPSCSTSLATNHLKGYKQQHDPERWIAPSRQVYPPARKMPRHSQRIHRWWRDWPTRLLWSHVASPKIRKKKRTTLFRVLVKKKGVTAMHACKCALHVPMWVSLDYTSSLSEGLIHLFVPPLPSC